jgi:hypothetical protein
LSEELLLARTWWHRGKCQPQLRKDKRHEARTSGFQQALEKLKGCLANDVVIKQELDLQCNVKSN